MGTQFLLDSFVGDPEEFYSLVIEEINQRELPDIEYKWMEEAESEKTFFNKGAKAKALQVRFKGEWIEVFGYQLGTCFFVSTRVTNRFYDPETSTYLYDVIVHCFEKSIERSTKKALARHMESRRAPVPKFLAANDNEPMAQEASN
jgi:hypothetical protein